MIRCSCVALLVGSAMLIHSAPAWAFSEKEDKYIKRQERYFKRGSVKNYQRACKGKLPATIDWKSFLPHIQRVLKRESRGNPNSYCSYPITTLWSFCKEGFHKEVKQQITRFVCKYGGKGKTKVSLKAGVLTFWVDFKFSNLNRHLESEVGRLLRARAKGGKFTIREMRYIKKQERYFVRSSIKNVKRACKTEIPATIDWMSFRPYMQKVFAKKLRRKRSPHAYCSYPLSELFRMCRDGKRRRVVAKVKRYVCKFGGKRRSRVKLRGGTLTFWLDFTKVNLSKYLKKQLGRRL